jgi:acylphosphatase
MNEAHSPEATFRAVVRGMVQGVGFRFFVVGQARRLGLTGMVRNLPDGRVEALARGPRKDLETLLDALRRGPRMSRVEGVDVQWDVAAPERGEFEIGF